SARLPRSKRTSPLIRRPRASARPTASTCADFDRAAAASSTSFSAMRPYLLQFEEEFATGLRVTVVIWILVLSPSASMLMVTIFLWSSEMMVQRPASEVVTIALGNFDL